MVPVSLARAGGAIMTDRRNVWTEAMDAALSGLWAEGATSGAIAAHFRTTRNAVIGRVHRIGLPPRPSPIPGHAPAKPKRVAPPPPLPPVVADPPVHRTPPRLPSVRVCQFPIGHPRERGFHYCGEPVWRGVYCRVCFARCYQRLPVAA
jgi:GcrA cell cycle regulator